MDYICLDLETTGDKPADKEIIELAAIRYKADVKQDVFHYFIKPKQRISSFILKLTSISMSDIEKAPTFQSIYKELRAFLGDYMIVAHNVGFDVSVLNREFERLSLPPLSNLALDSADLSLMLYPSLKKQSLKHLAAFLNEPLTRQHRALYDALCVGAIFQKMAQDFKVLKPELLGFLESLPEESALSYFIKKIDAKPIVLKQKKQIHHALVQALESTALITKSFALKEKAETLKVAQKNAFNTIYTAWRSAKSSALIWEDEATLAHFIDYLECQEKENRMPEASYIVLHQSNYLKKTALIKQWSQFKSRPDFQVAFTHWLMQTKDANLDTMHPRLAQSIDKQHLTTQLPAHLKTVTHILLDRACFYKKSAYLKADPNRELLFVKGLNFLKV